MDDLQCRSGASDSRWDRYMNYTTGMGIRRNRTRPVYGLEQGQHLNKALWSLAAEFGNR